MSKILVATDFSDVAGHATQYACQMAATYHLSVHLVNAHMVPIAFTDTPLPIVPLDETRQVTEQRMQDTVAQLKTEYPLLDITGECFLGEALDVLLDCSREMMPLLTVLGNSGSAADGAWLGSTVLSGMRRLSCPVLAVPEGYAFRQIQTICLACDQDDLNGGLELSYLLRLQEKLNAGLQLVYARPAGDPACDFENSRLKAALSHLSVSLQEVQGEDVAAAVHSAAVNMDADWLAVVPHRHNFFASLFHKSQTKAILDQSELPVLALHHK